MLYPWWFILNLYNRNSLIDKVLVCESTGLHVPDRIHSMKTFSSWIKVGMWCTANINYKADIPYLYLSPIVIVLVPIFISSQPPAHCWSVCETAPAVGLWALWNTFGLSLTWIDLPRHLDAIWDSNHMLSMLLDSYECTSAYTWTDTAHTDSAYLTCTSVLLSLLH